MRSVQHWYYVLTVLAFYSLVVAFFEAREKIYIPKNIYQYANNNKKFLKGLINTDKKMSNYYDIIDEAVM